MRYGSPEAGGKQKRTCSVLDLLRYNLINVDTLIPQHRKTVTVAYTIIASASAIAVMRAVDTKMAVAVAVCAVALVGYQRFYALILSAWYSL